MYSKQYFYYRSKAATVACSAALGPAAGLFIPALCAGLPGRLRRQPVASRAWRREEDAVTLQQSTLSESFQLTCALDACG